MSDQPAAKPECEHYWASLCFGGLSVRLCQLCHEPDWDDVRRQHAESVRAGILSERQRLCDELGHDHYVIFTEDRWTIEHSVECRLSGHMATCRYHEAVALIADEPRADLLGRWRIDQIDSEGLPALVRMDPETAEAQR